MLTSKQIIEKTGISRATLNNYISLGLLPRPLVQRAQKDHGRAPRIGYFSDEALERIQAIHQMKKEGLTMSQISEYFNPGDKSAGQVASISGYKKEQGARQSYTLEIGIDEITGPAYMVNNNFELLWWNDAAVETIFSTELDIKSDIAERNLIKLFLESDVFRQTHGWKSILSTHLEIAKKRLSQKNIFKINASLNHDDAIILSKMYEDAEPVQQAPLVSFPIEFTPEGEEATEYTMYACFFREGVFFVFAESELDNSPLLNFLSKRDHVIRNLLSKRKPFLTPLAVMVADLQNSTQICAELPPMEYFELINHIWQSAEPIFRKYYGTHGKHVGDGMVYYFFPQPDSNYNMNAILCAHELKRMIRDVSREWQHRKNWLHSLHLNIGLHEGQEWFGTYSSGSNLEFTVLGDTINHAARISDFAREGAIWATKSMIESLSAKDRMSLRFGIRRKTGEYGEEVLVKDTYSRISGIVDLNEGRNYKFHDIATLPVTEIIDLQEQK
jgi:class 3 adenylate cyclase/DNA-binding transcriptional MerR regulator